MSPRGERRHGKYASRVDLTESVRSDVRLLVNVSFEPQTRNTNTSS